MWGCETRDLRRGLLRRLEVFLHTSMRTTLGISIYQVADRQFWAKLTQIWGIIAFLVVNKIPLNINIM